MYVGIHHTSYICSANAVNNGRQIHRSVRRGFFPLGILMYMCVYKAYKADTLNVVHADGRCQSPLH